MLLKICSCNLGLFSTYSEFFIRRSVFSGLLGDGIPLFGSGTVSFKSVGLFVSAFTSFS
jgi:hypothetical protein